MNNTPHHMAAMLPQRIKLDGHSHTVISLSAMEGIGYEHAGSITYPPPGESGWATTRAGSHRFAAWYEDAEPTAEGLAAMVAGAADRVLDGGGL